jgi:hypothetical protein
LVEIIKSEEYKPIEPAGLFWELVHAAMKTEGTTFRQAIEKAARTILQAQGEWEVFLESRKVPFRDTVAFHVEQDYLLLNLDGGVVSYRRETRKVP